MPKTSSVIGDVYIVGAIVYMCKNFVVCYFHGKLYNCYIFFFVRGICWGSLFFWSQSTLWCMTVVTDHGMFCVVLWRIVCNLYDIVYNDAVGWCCIVVLQIQSGAEAAAVQSRRTTVGGSSTDIIIVIVVTRWPDGEFTCSGRHCRSRHRLPLPLRLRR